MKQYTLKEHLDDLKKRIIYVLGFIIILFLTCYYFSEQIFEILLTPLERSTSWKGKIIFTGLTEAFISYLSLSFYMSLILVFPIISYNIYAYLAPGLYENEKKVIGLSLIISPILFYLGCVFVYYYVMPRAWEFFLSFEDRTDANILVLEARISEYISITFQLIMAFGICFQLPIIIFIVNRLGIISIENLIKFRRYAIVIIFILSAIFTPPDVLSQVALALPLILLYEISIRLCIYLENKRKKC